MKEIMTPHEAAQYLRLDVRTIHRLVKNGNLPGRKVERSWRFRKDALDKWVSMRETPSFKDR